jgi:hypothetical protein
MKNRETLIDASKEVGLEINVEKIKSTLLSRHQNVGQNLDIKIANRSFVNMSQSVLPNHQFGLTQRHCNRTDSSNRKRISEALENKQYCSAAFPHISQAFDNVWLTGLLYKLRRSLPLYYSLILKSYSHSRHFLVKVETEYTELSSVNDGVPQGSVLGPLLYMLYTADLTTSPGSTTATFTDDTEVVTMDSDPAVASQKLQTHLLAIQNWFKKWRMKANESKSNHVTFTTRR